MQELWALLHFIMPSLFDSHDEFSEWFSKDIESHAESNTKLNQRQLKRLHTILKPFMLRRIKKNVQSELGDKIEIDVMCDLTQRQAKLYRALKSQLSSNYDAIENAAGTDDASGDQNLVNAVMQFRKVCNHPDLFERADIDSPFSFVTFGKPSSMIKRSSGNSSNTISNSVNNSNVNVANSITDSGIFRSSFVADSKGAITNGNATSNNYSGQDLLMYSTCNPISYYIPKLVYDEVVLPNFANNYSSVRKLTDHTFNILNPVANYSLCKELSRFTGCAMGEFSKISHQSLLMRTVRYHERHLPEEFHRFEHDLLVPNMTQKLDIALRQTTDGVLSSMMNIKQSYYEEQYLNTLHRGYRPSVASTPINIQVLGSSNFPTQIANELFDPVITQALSDIPVLTQYNMYVHRNIPVELFPRTNMYPQAFNKNFSSAISMPSMDRFITESAKLKKLDEMLPTLKAEGHRVLIYFQMTRMMDLMEEYLTYRQYKHIRLDGSSKLEDRRDLVHDWQTKPEIFIFLLSTRAGGLGINLTAADTVIFYDSDWNPTIDSQAMDRAHRLGQTKQVTVYRLLVKDTIEERMRDRARQKEQVQQVVMEGKAKEKNVKTIEATQTMAEVEVRA